MSEQLPFTEINGSGVDLYTVDEQMEYYAQLFDPANSEVVTPITNMLDAAYYDVTMGLKFLQE